MKIPAAAAKLAACNVSGENGTTPYQTGGSTLKYRIHVHVRFIA